MKLKNLLPKQSSKYLLALLFSFSLMSNNYAFSEDNKTKVEFSQEQKDAGKNMVQLQVLVETYAVINKDKYPAKVSDLKIKELYSENKKVNSSNGKQKNYKEIIDKAVDYSEYEKAINKDDLKNRVIYKPLNISIDQKSASAYKVYFTDSQGKLVKLKGQDYCLSTDECNDGMSSTQYKQVDNFSDPNGFIDEQYHYTYFAIKIDRKNKNQYDQILEKSLNEIKKGNKTQQIYFNLIMSYLTKKEYQKVNEHALNFIKDFPNSAIAHNLLAFDYQGEKSIGLFEKAVNLDPKNPLYRIDLADSYTANKLYNKALIEYEKVRSETPDIMSDLDEKITNVKKKIENL